MSLRRVLFGVLLASVLYGASYATARRTHQLVRYESGCVSRPNLHRDLWIVSCAELHAIDDYRGRSFSQRLFAPAVMIEERL